MLIKLSSIETARWVAAESALLSDDDDDCCLFVFSEKLLALFGGDWEEDA